MRYYIIAGEASGDLYGSQIIQHFKTVDKQALFRFWGGDKMLAEDPNLAIHIKKTAFMGFWEVLKNFGTINKLISFCKKDIIEFKPDALVFIDYPGFNLRICKWAKDKGFKTFYYVSPQLWAWKKSRYKTIRDYVDQMYVILPFEKGFYQGLGVDVKYFGHPLANELQSRNSTIEMDACIAVLPGSRKQEIEKHIPVILETAHKRKEDKFEIGLAPTIERSYLAQLLANGPANLTISKLPTRKLLTTSKLAIVSSGTATLETALLGVPQLVFYKTSGVSYAIGKKLIDLPWISLVNIIAGKQVVHELIQQDCNAENINQEINRLSSPEIQRKMNSEYQSLRSGLEKEDSILHVAEDIFSQIKIST